MLSIDQEELLKKYKEKDWNYVFKATELISSCILTKYFKIQDYELRKDIIQDCCENLYKKILANKIKEDGNLFCFIWKNSTYRILDVLKKTKNREKIAVFVSYDALFDGADVDANTDANNVISEEEELYENY